MSTPDIIFGEGDKAPAIAHVVKDAAGNPRDLTGATVAVRFRPMSQVSAAVTQAAALDADPTTGKVTWTPSSPMTPGNYNANWIVTLPGAAQLTDPADRYLWLQVLAAA